MSSREKFEAWVVSHLYPTTDYATARTYGGIYYSTVSNRNHRSSSYADVQLLWEAWQAALAAKE